MYWVGNEEKLKSDMERYRRRAPEHQWDEDDAFVYLAVQCDSADVQVWWTPEGTLEVLGPIKLLLQLAGRVTECSWGAADGKLGIKLEKAIKGAWGRLSLEEHAAVSFPDAGARREGLAKEIKVPITRGKGRRFSEWPRRWKQRMLLPLGYFAKLLHTTDYLDFVMWLIMVAMVLLCPYTKVEESFGIQAVHDILYHRFDLASYDHHSFPGVVARTFLGPLALALASAPAVWVARVLLNLTKSATQSIVRIVLGSILVMCFKLFRLEVGRRFGSRTSFALGLVSCTQFHFIFYMSRTLPNTFALGLVLLGLKMWMNERYTRMLFILTLTAVVFRFETVLLFAGILIVVVFVTRRVKFFWAVWCGVVFGLLCLLVTVGVDSVYWRGLLWPEGSGLYFNVVENQSHLFGVSPWHWYFSSALPRALLGALPLAVVGILVQPRVRLFVAPAISMVIFFSFLPHKELRFIFYAFPLFNLAAAAAMDYFWRRRSFFAIAGIGVLLFGSLAASSVMLSASMHNYPGGDALRQLHTIKGLSALPGTSVWLDNLALQSGVTRFQQERPDWFYSKVPETELNGSYSDFTFLITEREEMSGSFDLIGSPALVYAGLKRSFPPGILTRIALRIFENKL